MRTARFCSSVGRVYGGTPYPPYPTLQKGHGTRDTLPPPKKDMGPGTRKGSWTIDTVEYWIHFK